MNVVIVGTGRRCSNLYAPVVRALGLLLHGLCGRNVAKTQALASRNGARAYESAAQVLDDPEVDLVIVCVKWTENAAVYRQVAGSEKPALLETPLAATFDAAAEVAGLLSSRRAPTVVAEQYHLRPIELLKQRLILDGVFGDVTYAFSDGAGHEYHGISIIRSYLGFEQRLERVAAMQQRAPVVAHAMNRQRLYPWEQAQHALLRFCSGAQATYHWTWLAYDSPIRHRRIAGFHGSRGGAWGDECVVLDDPEAPAQHVRIERRTRVVDGVEVPHEYVALLGTRFLTKWSNRDPDLVLSEEAIVAAQFVRNLIGAVRGEESPLYTPGTALEDQRIVTEMRRAIEGVEWRRLNC